MNIPHPDPLIQRRALSSTHNRTNICSVGMNSIAGTGWRRFIPHFERDKLLVNPLPFLVNQGGSAHEFPFVKRHKRGKPSLEWGRFLVEFVTIKWIAHFGAQGIPGPQSTWLDA